MRTNKEIIQEYLLMNNIDYEYDGTNINSYKMWEMKGYQVKKGEKSFIKVGIWYPKKYTNKSENGEDENLKFYNKLTALFTKEQVEEVLK